MVISAKSNTTILYLEKNKTSPLLKTPGKLVKTDLKYIIIIRLVKRDQK